MDNTDLSLQSPFGLHSGFYHSTKPHSPLPGHPPICSLVLEVKKEQDGTEAADESRESEVEEEDEEEVADSDNEVIPEFRCLEKDCCRVFQEVPSLLQHYLQLHEFSLDKAGAILSRINLGRFACDQQGCVAMFTTFWKYVGHIKDMHGGVKLSRHETINGFSCDVEDCDRTYATKV
ncbi:hypothetical protein CRUP_031584 [Coryphaenoides rupestris]|nr:hypothetical protein CRUP_031584 [Coryphaenoides rupestris]